MQLMYVYHTNTKNTLDPVSFSQLATCVFSWVAMIEPKVANIDRFHCSTLKSLHYHTRHQCWHWTVQL
jgi:hypothetical protein